MSNVPLIEKNEDTVTEDYFKIPLLKKGTKNYINVNRRWPTSLLRSFLHGKYYEIRN